jgi:hypothetical protein
MLVHMFYDFFTVYGDWLDASTDLERSLAVIRQQDRDVAYDPQAALMSRAAEVVSINEHSLFWSHLARFLLGIPAC